MLWRECLLVFLGGGLGSVSRFLIGVGIKQWWTASFPLGTFIVNILGCFLIGCFLGLVDRHGEYKPQLVFLLSTGFCGGFTTFSSFTYENLTLIQQENYQTAFFYIFASLSIGLLCAYTGIICVKKL